MRSVRRLRGRVGSTLALLAVAPLLGLVVLSYSWISEANRTSDGLEIMQRSTTQLTRLVELEAALQDEQIWTGAAITARDFDLDGPLIQRATGVDPFAEQAAAIRLTDRLVASVDLPGLAAVIETARASDDPPAALGTAVDDIVAPAVRAGSDAAIELAAELRDGGRLVILLRKFEGANEVRFAFAALRTAFLSSFGQADTDQQRAALIELSSTLAVYDQTLSELQRLVPADGSIVQPLDAVVEDPSRQNFLDIAGGQLTVLGIDTPVSPADALADATPVTGDLRTVEDVNERHLQLVAAAAQVLTDEVELQRGQAQRVALGVSLATVAIAILTAGAIVAATRWLVRPLSDLGNTAAALTKVGSSDLPPATGPKEIRLIHEALGEAIDHLARTEQQAIALAAGDLDDPSLGEAVPGRLGASIQGAIAQLRSSLSQREEISDQLTYEATTTG